MVSSLTVLLWMISALCPVDAGWYFSGLIGRIVKLANVETRWSVLILPLHVLVKWCLGTGDFELIGGRTSLWMCIIPTVLIQYVTIRQTIYTQHFILVIQKATCFVCTRHLAFSITSKNVLCVEGVSYCYIPLCFSTHATIIGQNLYQILEFCHTSNGFISCLYVEILPCVLLTRYKYTRDEI
jgi:hypothetical protein